MSALTRNGLIDDTIITFMSDNGGPTAIEDIHPTGASNYPLRGVRLELKHLKSQAEYLKNLSQVKH